MSKGSWQRPGDFGKYSSNYEKIFGSGGPKSVSIVAQGASWREWEPGDETWAINLMGLRVPHDLLFHMDDCRVQEARAVKNDSIRSLVDLLEIHPKFITSKVYPEYPGAEAFPLQDVVDDLGACYFNSTVAYAVAYAIHRRFQVIKLYGADFTYPDAHKAEKGRGCVEYWLGVAKSRGIAVYLPPSTTLLDMNAPEDEKHYGYDAYTVQVCPMGRIELADKPIPTAQEIEKRYG